jgi:Tol biopolymer transport system component
MNSRLVCSAAVLSIASWAVAAAGGEAAAPLAGRIAFVRFSAQSGHPRIFVLRPGGGAPQQLRLPVTAAEGPVWSPDGGRLVFVGGANPPGSSDITGADYLYLWSAGHSGVRLLTRSRARVGGAAWAPDGKRIVFVRSATTGNLSALWTVRADGGGARRLTFGGTDLEPSWSPDGRVIAFVRIDRKSYQSGIWVVRAGGGGLHRILVGLKNVTEPVWSPDGGRLLVEDGRALYSVRPDGGGRRRIVVLSADASGAIEDPQPAWSPDGRWIVFCQLRRGGVGRSDLWIVRSGGGKVQRLARAPELDRDPTWGP